MNKEITPDIHASSHHYSNQRSICIGLDDYDDIFSDFDPRPYTERVISDDFLVELRKVCGENQEPITELTLLVPESKQNVTDENIISKRLHVYFKQKHFEDQKNIQVLIKKGVLFFLLGITLMMIASYASANRSENIFQNLVFTVSEPSGWFLVWSGLDFLFYSSRKQKPSLHFHQKLSKSRIAFRFLK